MSSLAARRACCTASGAASWRADDLPQYEGGNPPWLLPGDPSFDLDLANRRAAILADATSGFWREYTTEASIKALFSTFSTPAHYALGTDGILYSIPANSLDCFYMPAGICRGQLIEEARTNKCTNTNVNPGNSTNVSVESGTGTLSRVSDAAALASIGLSGNAFRLDNTASGGATVVLFGGTTGNTNKHTSSTYWRGTGQATLRLNGSGTLRTLPAAYARELEADITPATSNRQMRLEVSAGADVYFILNQLEEGAFVTSPIAIAGSTVTRAASDIKSTSIAAALNYAGLTMYAEVSQAPGAAVASGAIRVVSLNVDASNYTNISYTANASYSGLPFGRYRSGGVNADVGNNVADGIAIGNTSVHKFAAAFALNDLALSADGGTVRTQSTAAIPTGTPAEYAVGYATTNGPTGSAYFKRLAAYNSRKTNAFLQQITAP